LEDGEAIHFFWCNILKRNNNHIRIEINIIIIKKLYTNLIYISFISYFGRRQITVALCCTSLILAVCIAVKDGEARVQIRGFRRWRQRCWCLAILLPRICFIFEWRSYTNAPPDIRGVTSDRLEGGGLWLDVTAALRSRSEASEDDDEDVDVSQFWCLRSASFSSGGAIRTRPQTFVAWRLIDSKEGGCDWMSPLLYEADPRLRKMMTKMLMSRDSAALDLLHFRVAKRLRTGPQTFLAWRLIDSKEGCGDWMAVGFFPMKNRPWFDRRCSNNWIETIQHVLGCFGRSFEA
jgi:hypothetical protein